ncbi:MAG: ribbon-helix-helix domain-containing protein [Nanoarchaeota archaeon]|nr:ribbon-helix-helix domain-containing protein [Nanoarchaeota archaeon]MBU1705018.1 ribbon-helix-helix domain-containing protein [Nanoarchaeota archaeon]
MAKQIISATIDSDLAKWIDHELKDKKKYRNKSHLIELAIELLKEQ